MQAWQASAARAVRIGRRRAPPVRAADGRSHCAATAAMRAGRAAVAWSRGEAGIACATACQRAGFDERAAPEDPFGRRPPLAAPAQRGHLRPAARAAPQPAPLQLGPAALAEARGHEGRVAIPGRPAGPAESPQDRGRRLPRRFPATHHNGMASVGTVVQCAEIGDHLGPERGEVEGADQLQRVGLLLDHDGLLAVLEEIPAPPVLHLMFVSSIPGTLPGVRHAQTKPPAGHEHGQWGREKGLQ